MVRKLGTILSPERLTMMLYSLRRPRPLQFARQDYTCGRENICRFGACANANIGLLTRTFDAIASQQQQPGEKYTNKQRRIFNQVTIFVIEQKFPDLRAAIFDKCTQSDIATHELQLLGGESVTFHVHRGHFAFFLFEVMPLHQRVFARVSHAIVPLYCARIAQRPS